MLSILRNSLSGRWSHQLEMRLVSKYSAHPSTPPQSFRTKESNPARHDASHVGRFYTIPPEDYETLFETVTRGFPSVFRDQCRVFRECALLVRSPFVDLKNCIEAYSPILPTLRYLIYGQLGAGKTSTLCHLLHYGYSKGYLLVNVPWLPTWARFVKEYQPSATRPGCFDHTTNAVLWLSHFRTQNGTLLAELDLKTSKDYEWNQRESTPAGSPFTDLIEHGIARPMHSSECIYAIIQEVKQFSNEGKCRAMVLLDGVNTLYYGSVRMKDDQRKIVSPNKVTLFNAFRQFFKADWSGGVVACVVDSYAVHSDYRTSDLPRHLLKKEGWEDFDPFVPIHVDLYSPFEIQTAIDYYLERKWLAHPNASTPKARKELQFLSCQNPYTLMEICASR